MPDEFQYDVFLSHSAKDKAVVRPLAERLRLNGLTSCVSDILHSAFILLPSPDAPIRGGTAQWPSSFARGSGSWQSAKVYQTPGTVVQFRP